MKQPLGTTFIVAASLLGVAAVAQLVAILVYFGPGFKQTYTVAAAAPSAAPEATPAPAPQISEAEKTAQQARLSELLAEADKLEAGASPGDALVPLEEALDGQPRNAELIARVATLHERLGQTELAQATWQKVVALGPDAGKLFDIAEVRLKLLQGPAADEGMELRDQIGLQPGSALGVVDLKVKDGGTASTPVKDLRLAVKARPGDPIDARDVRINVTFYETLDGEIARGRTQRDEFLPSVSSLRGLPEALVQRGDARKQGCVGRLHGERLLERSERIGRRSARLEFVGLGDELDQPGLHRGFFALGNFRDRCGSRGRNSGSHRHLHCTVGLFEVGTKVNQHGNQLRDSGHAQQAGRNDERGAQRRLHANVRMRGIRASVNDRRDSWRDHLEGTNTAARE